jgi:hypothetical protein
VVLGVGAVLVALAIAAMAMVTAMTHRPDGKGAMSATPSASAAATAAGKAPTKKR